MSSVKSFRKSKKSLYNQRKPYFFKKLLGSHLWIDFSKCYTKTFGIINIFFLNEKLFDEILSFLTKVGNMGFGNLVLIPF